MNLAGNFMKINGGRESKYLFKAYGTITILFCIIHFVISVFFIDMNIISLGIYNMFSGFFYIFATWLVSRKYYSLVTIFTHVEICMFVIISRMILKYDYGFTVYLVAAAVSVGFNPFKREYTILTFSIIEVILFILLKRQMILNNISAEAEPLSVIIVRYINYSVCFVTVLIINFSGEITTSMVSDYYKGTMIDKLTGFYTKDYFADKVKEVFENNPEKSYYLLCTDISDFKVYNKIYGEKQGDEVLIAQSGFIKKLDIPNLVYGRLMGDEFGILIEDRYFSEEIFDSGIKRLQDKFSDEVYHMYIYVGIYKITDTDEAVPEMCEKARIAIDSVRGFYNNRFAEYNDKMLDGKLNEQKIISQFRRALDTNEFCIFLQPQMDENNVTKGAEALVRWKNPDGSYKGPGEFISIFERVGLITELDKFVWEQAVIELKKWKDAGRDDLSISVNISVKDFYYVDIYKFFTRAVEKYKIKPKNLKLEITESVMADNIKDKLEIIRNLQNYGFDIEIDDFGAGYSSFNMLKDIAANVVKIDMGFIRGDSSRGERSRSILKSIIDICRTLGMDVITEGIEDEAQLAMLSEMGCHLFQGYYFSRPISVNEFERIYM